MFSLSAISPVAFSVDDVRVIGSDVASDAFYFEGNEAKGALGEQFQCALSEAGYEAGVQVLPFQRAKILIEQGQTDVVFPLVQSHVRDEWATATEPVITFEPIVVSNTASIDNIAKLSDKQIATAQGSVFHEMLLTMGARVMPVTFYNQGIDMVLAGRIEAALVPKPLFEQLTAAQQAKLFVLRLPRVSIGFYVSKLSQQRDAIVTELNAAITKCHRSE
jgi:ABC-type amino acid transport substrate-binding protein